MSLFIYCPRKSTGARELAGALGATRLKRFDGMDFWEKGRRFVPEEGSTIICWGTALPDLEGLRVLNSLEFRLNKFQEWEKLVTAGIPSPRFTKPDRYTTPARYIQAGYLPRTFNHTGGLDLLNPTAVQADYYTAKEIFTKEIRIHCFDGKSIRAGQKVPMDGLKECTAEEWKPNSGLLHPWVRSYDGGWRISYDGFASTQAMRDLAKKSVDALGLTFGAVDLAQRPNGTFVVLEVNSAPGIEGNTLNAYVRAIKRWAEKAKTEDTEE